MNDHDPDGELRLILRALELDFAVEVAPAAGLQGAELRAWIAAADTALFCCQNCCTQAQLTPRTPRPDSPSTANAPITVTASSSGGQRDLGFMV